MRSILGNDVDTLFVCVCHCSVPIQTNNLLLIKCFSLRSHFRHLSAYAIVPTNALEQQNPFLFPSHFICMYMPLFRTDPTLVANK